jgi:hypothetical protein
MNNWIEPLLQELGNVDDMPRCWADTTGFNTQSGHYNTSSGSFSVDYYYIRPLILDGNPSICHVRQFTVSNSTTLTSSFSAVLDSIARQESSQSHQRRALCFAVTSETSLALPLYIVFNYHHLQPVQHT